MEHIPFQFFAWGASITFAIESLLLKYLSKHKVNNPWLLNITCLFFTILLNSSVSLYMGAGWPSAWGNILLAALFFALGMTLFNLVAYQLDVSVFIPLENFKTIFSVILGAMFLGEVLTGNQMYLIGAMVVAGIFVTFDENFSIKSFFSKGVILALVEMLAISLMALFLNKAAVDNNFWTLNLWYNVIAAGIMLFTWPLFSKDIKTLDKSHIGIIFLFALAGATANLLSAKAFTLNIGISQAIIAIPLSVIIAMASSLFFPKLFEHHTWKVYILRIASAATLIFAGIKLS